MRIELKAPRLDGTQHSFREFGKWAFGFLDTLRPLEPTPEIIHGGLEFLGEDIPVTQELFDAFSEGWDEAASDDRVRRAAK